MSDKLLDTEALYETPEGIALRLRAAGAAPRGLAWLIDFAIRFAVFFAASMLLSFLGESGQGLMLILMFLLMWGYPVLFELVMDGQTPGKRVMGLRVVHGNGTPVGFTASLIRNLMRTVDSLPIGYGFGLVSCSLDQHARRLGDRVAGTLVVHAEKIKVDHRMIPEVPVFVPDEVLRADEQAVVVAFAERAGSLTDARRIELADLLSRLTRVQGAAAVQRLLGFANHLLGR